VGMLQAILQVMLQGAGPIGYYLKVLKGCFVCWVLCSKSVLFLGPRSWVFCSWALRLLGVLGRQSRQSSAGTRRPMPRLVACLRVVAGCFKGVSGRGSVRRFLRIYFLELATRARITVRLM